MPLFIWCVDGMQNLHRLHQLKRFKGERAFRGVCRRSRVIVYISLSASIHISLTLTLQSLKNKSPVETSLTVIVVSPCRMSDRVTLRAQQSCVSEELTFDILLRYAPELHRHINLNILVPYLLSAELLTRDEAYTLTNSLFTPGERIISLLLFIRTKGRNGPSRLLHCIRRSVNDHGAVAAGGHAYLDKLLSGASQPNEQMKNCEEERRHIQRLKCKRAASYSVLVEETYQQLKDMNDDHLVKMFLSALPIVSCEEKKIIQKAKDLQDVFYELSICSCWGYRDTLLLESIIDRFCDHHMAEKMDKYLQELRDDEAGQLVPPSSPLKHSPNLNPGFTSLVINVYQDFQNQEISIAELCVYSTLLPTILPVEYSHFEQEHLDFLAEPDMSKLFIVLGSYWDERCQLLQCLVDRFGSPKLTEAVKRYIEDLSKTIPCPEHTTRLSVTKTQVAQLKQNFAEIVIRFLEFLRKGAESTPVEVKRFLSNLPASTLLPEKKLLPSTISQVDSWCGLFLHLTHSWDFLNCRILQVMLKKFGNDQLNRAFEVYQKQCLSFLKQTPPGDLMAVLPNRQPPARKDYTKVTLVSSSSRWQEDNLEYFDTFVNTLTTEFNLEAQCAIVYNAEFNRSTSTLHFYLPTSVAGLLLIVNTEDKASFYRRHKVSHVELHEVGHVYFDIHLSETSCPEDMFMLACKNQDLEKRLQLTELKAKLQVSHITHTGMLSQNVFDYIEFDETAEAPPPTEPRCHKSNLYMYMIVYLHVFYTVLWCLTVCYYLR